MKKRDTFLKKFFKQFLIITAGIIIGYLLYYNIFMEVIPLFISAELPYIIISLACLIGCIGGSIGVIELISSKKIGKPLFITLCSAYIVAVICILFLRPTLERIFIFNPLTGIYDMLTDSQASLQAIMNFLLFIPSGYFLRKLKPFPSVAAAILISVVIELIQVASMRGFFDVFDILLYIAGFLTGRLIFRKFKIQIG